MSGGVDSGMAAALVVKAGYKAAGFHMHLWSEIRNSKHEIRNFENKCCSTESLEAARKTAHKLRIPFYIVDFEKIFKKQVVDYFLKEYGLGQTPNPCVRCNKFIKFGQLLNYIKKLGYDFLATGHYARIMKNAEVAHPNFDVDFRFSREKTALLLKETHSRSQCEVSQNLVGSPRSFHLLMGKDKTKDQSYFLFNLTQKQLAQVMFPVGNYLKKEVKALAKKWQLPVAERPESQEICFFPETDYRPFLKRQIPKKIIPGEVADTKGKVIGRHQGIPLYTIGQRHGFEVNVTRNTRHATRVIPPYYVIAKDTKRNQLIVGFGKESERKEFWVKDFNWINPYYMSHVTCHMLQCYVRIRHQGELLKARIKGEKRDIGDKRVKVILDEGERGVAAGQAAVFYLGKEVLGGGIISLVTRG